MESFADLLEQSEVEKKMRPGVIIDGTVLAVGSEYVTVHAGLKSESTIPVDQFRNENGEVEVAVGDRVEVALDTVEDGFGATKLSRERASGLHVSEFATILCPPGTTRSGGCGRGDARRGRRDAEGRDARV